MRSANSPHPGQRAQRRMMFALVIYLVTLHQVLSVCDLPDICTNNKTVQTEIAARHNAFRRNVQPTASNMLKMSYDEKVAASAQAWVDKCILAHGPPSTRSLNGYVMGENLFYSQEPYSWDVVISTWHNEASHFKYPNVSTTGQQIGHYTQVIWNSSYKVGCGVASCRNNIYLYGCHYYRAGNFQNWPPYKEGPSCGSCPNNCEDKLCTNPCDQINRFLNCPALKAIFGCGNRLVSAWCPAACTCTDKIIPVA